MRFFSFVNKAAKNGLATPRSYTVVACALSLAIVLYAAFGGVWDWVVFLVMGVSMFSEDWQRAHWDRGLTTKWGDAVSYSWACSGLVLLAAVSWLVYKWAAPVLLLASVPIMWQGYYVAIARGQGQSVTQ